MTATDGPEEQRDETLKAFSDWATEIVDQIEKGDHNFNKAIVKFTKSYNKMNLSQNTSSLHCYGKTFLKACRGKIKVQPTAVARRKIKNGAHQKTDTCQKRKLDPPN